MRNAEGPPKIDELNIYITRHCDNCDYARQVAQSLHRDYPQLQIAVIALEDAGAEVPAVVFATPTYLLNGHVWSLGNPSATQIVQTFGPPKPGA